MGSRSRLASWAMALALLTLAGCEDATPAARARTAVPVPPVSPAMLLQPSAVNGCDPLTAEVVAGPEVAVEFGGAIELRYRPRCLSLAVGQAVRFRGEFGLHPMAGGAILEGAPVRDPLSPLPFVSAGQEATFRALRPGVYPYYCQVHWIVGMSGVIYVP